VARLRPGGAGFSGSFPPSAGSPLARVPLCSAAAGMEGPPPAAGAGAPAAADAGAGAVAELGGGLASRLMRQSPDLTTDAGAREKPAPDSAFGAGAAAVGANAALGAEAGGADGGPFRPLVPSVAGASGALGLWGVGGLGFLSLGRCTSGRGSSDGRWGKMGRGVRSAAGGWGEERRQW